MKTVLLTMALVSSLSANASVVNAFGDVSVSSIFQSDSAAVIITGPAATSLYNLLQVEQCGFDGSLKAGQNILCRLEVKPGSNTEEAVCSLQISPDGGASAF